MHTETSNLTLLSVNRVMISGPSLLDDDEMNVPTRKTWEVPNVLCLVLSCTTTMIATKQMWNYDRTAHGWCNRNKLP